MRFIVNRFALLLLTLVLISIVTFVITNILPGDVAMVIMGTRSNEVGLEAIREQLGLNDPLLVQYGRWIWGMLQGDFGRSMFFKVEIADILASKVMASAMIVVLSLTIAMVLAVPLGIISAIRQNRWQDTAASGLALAGISLPDFFWGIVMILLFSRALGWFPSSGFASPFEDFWLAMYYAALPAFALGFGLMAHLARMTRSAMLEVLGQDFIRVCRAKGLAEGAVIIKHALRNAIAPVLTIAGLQLGYLFGSIVVIETLFNFTGMGWLTYQALVNRDVPLIQATVFLIATVFMFSNLIVDILYAVLDPRIGFK